MLIFDELKKNDPQLRLVAMVLAGGLGILLAGLWWVQIVSAQEYKSHQETQAYRSVRIPAVRGKILDREGRVLAENRPRYNLSLYLDDLRKPFDTAYGQLRKQALDAQQHAIAAQEKKLGRSLTKVERKQFALTTAQIQQLRAQSRLSVANDLAAQIGRQLGQPVPLDAKNFERAYQTRLAMPYPILKNLNEVQIARFEEKFTNGFGADLELQAARVYPSGATAAHLLGYLRSDDSSAEGEESYFSYRLPDYRGVVGIEGGFDAKLRGMAGAESVLVNNLGYRQSENIWSQPEPGHNVVLTIDLNLQRAAENSLVLHRGAEAKAAIVVMDVRSGDVLAMVSSPTFDPNDFAQGISQDKWDRLQQLSAEKNRATYENYAPGSIFKTVIALAALENGLDPSEVFHVHANPENPAKGIIYVGKRSIKDTAPPGDYDFRKAFIHSSNSYFITNGLRAGVENIIRIGKKFHLGERTGLFTNQETRGNFPSLPRVISRAWRDGDTANLCIGQGELAVTPVQMAVMVSAIANGGKVLWPRIVDRIEPQDPASGEMASRFPAGVVRDELGVHPRSLKILRDAMRDDVSSSEGTGTAAAVEGMQVCGKTGTAQVQDASNKLTGYNFWFASFAPYEKPRYAIVVMVESTDLHGSGGSVCAPIAHDVYEAILKQENARAGKVLARN
ncbi:MAG: penicillin-binding transpeptidase domain-containing protein [Verrucomicrobiales bacterium]|nr:penicillin-binding transpeptidase domain-containing protein [Verrucomicrobiales bacterium]